MFTLFLYLSIRARDDLSSIDFASSMGFCLGPAIVGVLGDSFNHFIAMVYPPNITVDKLDLIPVLNALIGATQISSNLLWTILTTMLLFIGARRFNFLWIVLAMLMSILFSLVQIEFPDWLYQGRGFIPLLKNCLLTIKPWLAVGLNLVYIITAVGWLLWLKRNWQAARIQSLTST